MQEAFATLKFDAGEVDDVLSIVAAIVHLGDIAFEEAADTHTDPDETVPTVRCVSGAGRPSNLLISLALWVLFRFVPPSLPPPRHAWQKRPKLPCTMPQPC